MIAADQWLRIWMFSMEVAGSNTGRIFNLFIYFAVTVLLEYLNPTIYNCLVFAL